MLRKIVYILVALQCLTLVQNRNGRLQLVVHNFTCQMMTDHMKRFDCYFKKLADNYYVFNQYLMFTRNLGKEFEARLWVQVLLQNGKKRINVIDVKLNVCESLSKPFESAVLMVMLNEIKRSSNMPRTCPVKGNFLYRVNNSTLHDGFFPPYTPSLNFSYSCEFYYNKVLFAASNLTGAAVSNKN